MVLEHYALRHGFLQCAAKIVIGVIIDQRAGVDAALTVLLDDHLTEIAHELVAQFGGQMRGHAVFGDLGHIRYGTGRMKVRELDDGDVSGDAGFAEVWLIGLVDCRTVFTGKHQACDGDAEALLVQAAKRVDGLLEIPLAPGLIVLHGVRVVQADPEAERIRFLLKGKHLGELIHQRLSRVRQDQAWSEVEGVIQDQRELWIDEGFPASERELVHTQFNGLVDKGFGVCQGDELESVITGGVAFATPDKPGEPVEDGRIFELESEPRAEWLRWDPAIELE